MNVNSAAVSRTHQCQYCLEPLLPAEDYCSRCLRPVAGKSETPPAPVKQDAPAPARPSSGSSGGALYSLESAVRCPQCEKEIKTFRVLRVLRTQVSFTSTLPRKGYVIVCPECDGILSAGLSGLI